MAHESFEDPEVAKLLNDGFVSIKVDREERPDIDHLYMTVCQAMTGQGGWPLSVFLTPDQRPFLAGTYFPKRRRYGRIGFIELLEQILDKWERDRAQIEAVGTRLVALLEREARTNPGSVPGEDLLHEAVQQLSDSFDPLWGGFGSAPKFPSPHQLLFLLRYAYRTGHVHARHMVERTLDGMACGGIFDHVGGGFARYSTDDRWLVPHFEKMLYDNALLALTYTEAYQATGRPLYAEVACRTLDYLLRDMRLPEGAFYAAEDADSGGEEGRFYLWTPAEVQAVLGDPLAHLYCRFFHITEAGNFAGRSIPNLVGPWGSADTGRERSADGNHDTFEERMVSFCRDEGLDPVAWRRQVAAASEQLRLERAKRVRPARDEKVLTGWNGLAVAALSRAGRVFGVPRYVEAAVQAEAWLHRVMRRRDGRLLARWCDGEAAVPAFLEDYAFLALAELELYQATWQPPYLERAVMLQRATRALFWDEDGGGFYLSGTDAEALVARTKVWYDGATPSGNSVALWNLLQIARLTGDTDWDDWAAELLRAFSGEMSRYPAGYAFALLGLQWAVWPTEEIVVAFGRKDALVEQVMRRLQTAYLPFTVCLVRPDERDSALADFARVSPFAAEQAAPSGETAIYVCERMACRRPLVHPSDIAAWLARL
ncbi:MAG: thioredoxin domain-containing protein [Alicyclobacillus sp.]|nr:thioredoxin domain-containing protein [Alicyclobacillus sp.]